MLTPRRSQNHPSASGRSGAPSGHRDSSRPRRVAGVAGVMMLGGAALNTVLVSVRPDLYPALGEWFRELSPWSLGPLGRAWDATFGTRPRVWGGVVGIGYEAVIGVLSVSRRPRRRVLGLLGIIVFKCGLLALGLWAWAVPWLVVLVPTVIATTRSERPESTQPRP
jgi:hypothetical protein